MDAPREVPFHDSANRPNLLLGGDREMVLVKVYAEAETRAEVLRIAEIFRAKVVDVTPKTYVLEVTGDEGKIQAVVDLLKPLGIKEMVRTGKIAIARGQRML